MQVGIITFHVLVSISHVAVIGGHPPAIRYSHVWFGTGQADVSIGTSTGHGGGGGGFNGGLMMGSGGGGFVGGAIGSGGGGFVGGAMPPSCCASLSASSDWPSSSLPAPEHASRAAEAMAETVTTNGDLRGRFRLIPLRSAPGVPRFGVNNFHEIAGHPWGSVEP